MGSLGTVWRGSSAKAPVNSPQPERASWNIQQQQEDQQQDQHWYQQDEHVFDTPPTEVTTDEPIVTIQEIMPPSDDESFSERNISCLDLNDVEIKDNSADNVNCEDHGTSSPPTTESQSNGIDVASSAVPSTQTPILWTEYEHRTTDVNSGDAPASQRTRMLFDPKSGSMVPHSQNTSARPETKGISKSKQRRLRREQQNAASSTSLNPNIPMNSNTTKSSTTTGTVQVMHRPNQSRIQTTVFSKQSNQDEQSKTLRKRTLPRTCGVLYCYIDPKTLGLADPIEAVYAMRGYGSYSIPGGILSNSSNLTGDKMVQNFQKDRFEEDAEGEISYTVSADQLLRSNAPSWQPIAAVTETTATHSQFNTLMKTSSITHPPSSSNTGSHLTDSSNEKGIVASTEDDHHLLGLGLGFDPTSATHDIIMSPPISSTTIASNSVVPSMDLDSNTVTASSTNTNNTPENNIGHFAILGSPSRRRTVNWNFRSLKDGVGILEDDDPAW